MVIAVFDPVQRALAGALSVLQVPAADLSQGVLLLGKRNLLPAGKAAVAEAIRHHQSAAALDQTYQIGVINFGADHCHPNPVIFFRINLAGPNFFQRFPQQRQNQPLGTGIAHQNQDSKLIAGDGRNVQLAQFPDLREDAADLVMFPDCRTDGGI